MDKHDIGCRSPFTELGELEGGERNRNGIRAGVWRPLWLASGTFWAHEQRSLWTFSCVWEWTLFVCTNFEAAGRRRRRFLDQSRTSFGAAF